MTKYLKKLLIVLFILGGVLGIGAGVYLSEKWVSLQNYDYVCGIEEGVWGDCTEGAWTEWNVSNSELVSSSGEIIPPKSRLYSGVEKRQSFLLYGNTRTGCDGTLLFSSIENQLLKLRNSKEEILQEIDLTYGGMVELVEGGIVPFQSREVRFCQKTETKESISRTPSKRKRK